jgi:hypothetical protein
MATEAEKLAKKIFGSKIIKPQSVKKRLLNKKYKIVVFVPLANTDEVTFAMASAGAGLIGNYSLCSFRMKGAGTFMGNENSDPAAGEKGKFEMTEEIRLEMICDKKNLNSAIEHMYEVHPYEEPAYEVYEVLTGTKSLRRNYLKIPLDKKVNLKNLLKKINPLIEPGILPEKIKGLKFKECIIDLRENSAYTPAQNTLYITKSNNKIKVYFA